MKSKIALNTLRSIKKSPGRFIAVMAIIAIGCCFFSGVKVACGDMKDSAWEYYENQQLADIQVKSTLGLTEDDLNEMLSLDEVEKGEIGYSADLYVNSSNGEVLVKVLSYSENSTINIPYLIEGRLPQNSGEILVDDNADASVLFSIGDTVTFSSPTEDDIADTLNVTTYTVVGICKSPLYTSYDRGSSTVGNGTLEAFFYIPEEDFAYEVYTDIFLRLYGTDDANPFSDEYLDIVEAVEDKLEEMASERLAIRGEDATADARQEIEDAKAELEDAKKEIEDAKKEYQDGLDEYNDGVAELTENRQAYSDAVTEYENSMIAVDDSSTASSELLSTCYLLDSYIEKYEHMYQQQLFDSTLSDIQSIQDIYDKYGVEAQISDYLAVYIITNPDKDPTGKELAKQAIMTINEEVRTTASNIVYYSAPLQEEALTEVGEQLSETSQQLGLAEAELAKAKRSLDSAAQEIADAEEEIADAEQEIADAEQEIADTINDAEWYVWNRSEFNPSCMSYGEDADRVDAIAKVFPIFFIIVAALMCATTMSRMVEEQRTEAGTLKSLGYSKNKIVFQYVVYAVSASILGCGIGTAIGFQLLPNIIYDAYQTMYDYPIFSSPFKPMFALGCLGVSILCTAVAAVVTANTELDHVPAELVRPKPPKSGKRIFLENIKFIWSKLSFTSKVTCRNLFRYKSRFLITVIGVGGSCALMLTGIGLKYSISTIVDLQYEELFVYDAIGILSDTASEEEVMEYNSFLDSSDVVASYTLAKQESKVFSSSTDEFECYLFVPDDLNAINDYIIMRERISGDTVKLDDTGCVISEKLSRELNVSKGDIIYIEGAELGVKVIGIIENYTYNYCYITKSTYESLFSEYSANIMLINVNGTLNDTQVSDFSKEFIANDGIISVTFMYNAADNFKDLVSTLDLIVVVIVAFAGALSFVILLNLANITVNERERELATIKVLGFFDRELSAYVYRENIISTIIGLVIGLIGGKYLESFVIKTAEVDAVMFSPAIPINAYIYAVLLMIAFVIVVNIILYFKLRKIDMAASMKAIE